MLNLAGREYDFGPVLFTVLQDCEHRRRSAPADDAEAAAKLSATAREKLAEIKTCYDEAGGSAGYWRELETEVLETALPQYARAAAAQTRLELASYGLWRQGDPLSRLALGLAGLTVGGLIVKAPFIPVFEDAFAFALAAAAFFYPEIKRLVFDWRYSRLLNRLVAQAEGYQHRQLPYVSEAGLEAELSAVSAPATGVPAATLRPVATAASAAGPRPTLVPAPQPSFAPPETASPPPAASRPHDAEPAEPPPAGPRPKAAERR
jgi:hypothetical protein